MADLSYSRTNRKRSSFATKYLQRKSVKSFNLHPPLRRLVSFVARIITWKVRCWVTDTQTDRHTDTQTKYCNPCCACAPRVNNRVFSSNVSVFSVCGFGHSDLQSFKCVCGVWRHVVCIHDAHFPSSPDSAQLFCLHCTLVWLFCCKTYLLFSPDPILALASMG